MLKEAWYSYSQIQFRRKHVQFILDNAVTLCLGTWPKQPIDSGYIDSPYSQQNIQSSGKFTKPAEVFAEVEVRLNQCNTDGHITLGYYLGDFNLDWMLEYEDCTEEDIFRKINRAIAYASSGPCRRWMPCLDAKCTKCNRTGRPKQTYGEWLNSNHRHPRNRFKRKQ